MENESFITGGRKNLVITTVPSTEVHVIYTFEFNYYSSAGEAMGKVVSQKQSSFLRIVGHTQQTPLHVTATILAPTQTLRRGWWWGL